MQHEAELKEKIFRLIDAQHGDSLNEVYNWLSSKLKDQDTESILEKGYRKMADDKEREHEAFEWVEGTLLSNEP